MRARSTARAKPRRSLPAGSICRWRCGDDLIELDFGEWTGLTFDQVRNDERWLPWRGCRSIAAIPGGESWRQVQDRVVGALFDLRRRHPGGAVALVSHGDVIRAALLFGLGMPLDLYNRIEIGTGSISTIRIEERPDPHPRAERTAALTPPRGSVSRIGCAYSR